MVTTDCGDDDGTEGDIVVAEMDVDRVVTCCASMVKDSDIS